MTLLRPEPIPPTLPILFLWKGPSPTPTFAIGAPGHSSPFPQPSLEMASTRIQMIISSAQHSPRATVPALRLVRIETAASVIITIPRYVGPRPTAGTPRKFAQTHTASPLMINSQPLSSPREEAGRSSCVPQDVQLI